MKTPKSDSDKIDLILTLINEIDSNKLYGYRKELSEKLKWAWILESSDFIIINKFMPMLKIFSELSKRIDHLDESIDRLKDEII